MPRRPPLRAAILLVGAVAVAGCSQSSSAPTAVATGPVAVPVPSPTGTGVVAACAALLASLPDTLAEGVRRRPVADDTGRAAAWGDPPVRLRCGVPRPGAAAVPIVIDGFPLVPDETEQEVTYTTADRAVAVSVEIPRAYESQAYLILDLIPQLRRMTPSRALTNG